MDGPVDFDNKAARVTVEVRDVSVDYLLAAEMQAMQSIALQSSPQQGLFPRRRIPEVSGLLRLVGLRWLADDNVSDSCPRLPPYEMPLPVSGRG